MSRTRKPKPAPTPRVAFLPAVVRTVCHNWPKADKMDQSEFMWQVYGNTFCPPSMFWSL